jgi:phosphate transport system substrate-binding protein
MMRTPLLITALIAMTGLATGCDRPSVAVGDVPPGHRTIAITGSSTIAPLVLEIARRFEAEHPGVRVEVQTGGSSRGIRDTRSGAAAIGMSSRDLTETERADLAEHGLATDAVAFIVHADNPVESLTPGQLRGIYSGVIERWSEVGGPDQPIVVSNRADGRSELTIVTDYLGLDIGAIHADVVDGETQQSIKTVTGNVRAITYVSAGAAAFEAERGAPLRLLPLQGVTPTSAAVASGAYPLARPLLLLTRHDAADPLIAEFVAFATSAGMDDLIRKQAYVPPTR